MNLSEVRRALNTPINRYTVRKERGLFIARWSGKTSRHIDMNLESLEHSVRRLAGARVTWSGRVSVSRGGYAVPTVEVHFTLGEG